MFSVEGGDVADQADHPAFGAFLDGGGDGLLFVFMVVELNLDEFMTFQGFVDGRDEAVGEAVLSHKNDGLDVVREGAQVFSLGSAQFSHGFHRMGCGMWPCRHEVIAVGAAAYHGRWEQFDRGSHVTHVTAHVRPGYLDGIMKHGRRNPGFRPGGSRMSLGHRKGYVN